MRIWNHSKKEHNCICEYFVEDMAKGYISQKDWEVMDFDDVYEFKVLMKNKEGNSRVFQVDAHNYGENHYMVSFHDITILESLNKELDAKLKEQIEQIRQKDQLLQQQSKLASMGEMIGAIAHQWRQPLNALNINIQNLEEDFEEGLIDQKFIEEFMTKNRAIIEFMSKTIDDFRNFFRIDKEKQHFFVEEVISDVLSIQSAQLKNHNIFVEVSGDDFSIDGYKSEFGQVLLNIINNSKDAIVQNNIENGYIKIKLHNHQIDIIDNGGGIPQDIIERIYEPYFTTKEQGKGTGMGLYMSKMIIEGNMGGKMKASSNENETKVSIII
jgi:signal transduction histidine kinase